MQSLTALLFVPIMAILIRVQASSSADTTSSPYTTSSPDTTSSPYTTSSPGLFSEEAMYTMNEVQNYITVMDQEYDDFSDELKEGNNVLDALAEYRDIRESAKNTECKGDELPVDDDQEILQSMINECTSEGNKKKLLAFLYKVEESKAEVKKIDETLKEIAKNCDSDLTGCEENKNKALADLNNVVSAEAKAGFENDIRDVLVDAKNHLEVCFTQASEDMLNDLQRSTKAISSCLSTISDMTSR